MITTIVNKINKILSILLIWYCERFYNFKLWNYISVNQPLSENFIRKYQDKVNWEYISRYQKLSEVFIKEFKYRVNWLYITANQTLSESFIREFKDKVYWPCISEYQKLSESFIKEFKDKVYWPCISRNQTLSESFIREFKDRVNWVYILENQTLSKEFISDIDSSMMSPKIDNCIEFYNVIHKEKSFEQKRKEVIDYAKKWKLKVDENYLYAYRNHDHFGRGVYNKATFYDEKNVYYRDWKCDMREDRSNSFGIGIFPKGNTKVKVKIEDWGCEVEDEKKARVWGFEIYE